MMEGEPTVTFSFWEQVVKYGVEFRCVAFT